MNLQEKFSRSGRAEEKTSHHPNSDNFTPQFTDPRPDMEKDSKDWVRFLESCHNVSPDLYYTLHGFRCMGTRLLRGQHSYILRPEITGQGWEDTAHYERIRDKELAPWRGEIVAVLRGMM